jgi:hypothetical protein
MSFLFAYLDRSRPSACCELCRRDVLSDVLNDEELSLVVRHFFHTSLSVLCSGIPGWRCAGLLAPLRHTASSLVSG